jgi:hypothetical protein
MGPGRGKPDREKNSKKERYEPPELDYVDYVYAGSSKNKV